MTPEDLAGDAASWAKHFAHDVRNNHCSNHDHDCKETCVKYVNKKLKAKESLAGNKVPSCRFWFFRIKVLEVLGCKKRLRRRGKPLVAEPYIEEDDERNDQYRCKVKREQPFRSTSNDVSQSSDRCNVDYQFLPCAPSHAPQLVVAPTASSGDASQSPRATTLKAKWMSGCDFQHVAAEVGPMLESFAAAFRKAFAMDFYITKYQGKMMQSLTPLFQTMTEGLHRLAEEEKAEDAKAEEDRLQNAQPKRRRTIADLRRRARKITIRLATTANRCYWLSCAEVAIHILTGADCLQSHCHQRLFTRQLQWALQECKRHLNKECESDASKPQDRKVFFIVKMSVRGMHEDRQCNRRCFSTCNGDPHNCLLRLLLDPLPIPFHPDLYFNQVHPKRNTGAGNQSLLD